MATHSSILAWEIPWTEELGVAKLDTTEPHIYIHITLLRVLKDKATNENEAFYFFLLSFPPSTFQNISCLPTLSRLLREAMLYILKLI